MDIQITTDHNITSTVALTARVEAAVRDSLVDFQQQITSVGIHFTDENSDQKSGPEEMRCVVEARLAGRKPVAVSHQAGTLDAATDGATGKMRRLLTSDLGKIRSQ